jgi:hypothetical protein
MFSVPLSLFIDSETFDPVDAGPERFDLALHNLLEQGIIIFGNLKGVLQWENRNSRDPFRGPERATQGIP